MTEEEQFKGFTHSCGINYRLNSIKEKYGIDVKIKRKFIEYGKDSARLKSFWDFKIYIDDKIFICLYKMEWDSMGAAIMLVERFLEKYKELNK